MPVRRRKAKRGLLPSGPKVGHLAKHVSEAKNKAAGNGAGIKAVKTWQWYGSLQNVCVLKSG